MNAFVRNSSLGRIHKLRYMKDRVHILIVEDEPKLANALRDGFEDDQYRVSVARSGEDGFFLLYSENFDLVILDVMLPGRNGVEVLRQLRRNDFSIPILLLTARDSVEDRVLGLDAGADDYLVKPFAFPELLARVRALLRRGVPEKPVRMSVGSLVLDVAGRTVFRDGKAIDLTAREYDLLKYLFRNQGTVVSREMLVRDVWKEITRAIPIDNVIDVHVARLRRKSTTALKQS